MEQYSTGSPAPYRLRSRWLLQAIGIAASLAACSSNPPAPSATTPTADRVESARTTTAARPPVSGNAAGPSSRSDALAANAEPAKRSVYFDYDSSLVGEEYKSVVVANARWVSGHGKTAVVIQGNTDERGSREYNLALGQRRADAVKERMTLLGVPAGSSSRSPPARR